MILSKINLVNYCAFEQLELEFQPDVNVIAGVNGVGKSALLRAISVLLSRALPEFTVCTARPLSFEDDDVFAGKRSLETSAVFSVEDQRCHISVQRNLGDEADAPEVLLLERLHTEDTTAGDLDAAKRETRKVLQELKNRENQPVPILFTPRRRLPGKPRKLPEPKLEDQSRAFILALAEREVELRDIMVWFNTQETLLEDESPSSISSRASRERILDFLRRVVSEFLPGFMNLRIERKPSLRFLVDKNGVTLSLNQLSDGERGLLAIVLDITRRLAIANPSLADPISDGKGIVLIDEIELHLHPRWQRHGLRRLRSTFANCQFIITTHSPQVIGQVRPANLALLYRNDQGRVELNRVDQSFGMDSSWILQQIMDAPARDIEIARKLRAIWDAIDGEDLLEARKLTDELENDVGFFPELQEARSTVDRLEILLSHEKNQ